MLAALYVQGSIAPTNTSTRSRVFCGQVPGVRSRRSQVSHRPRATYSTVEPVPEEKGGQAGRQRVEVAASAITSQGGRNSTRPTSPYASGAGCDCGRGDENGGASPGTGWVWQGGGVRTSGPVCLFRLYFLFLPFLWWTGEGETATRFRSYISFVRTAKNPVRTYGS